VAPRSAGQARDGRGVAPARSEPERACGFQRLACVHFITRHLLSRRFDEDERSSANRAYQKYFTYYAAHPEDAKKLLATGESKADETLPVVEFAALSMVASLVMNLDEVLNK